MINFGPKIPQVEVETVKKVADGDSQGIIVDVRTPEEFHRRRIKESINIPLDSLPSAIEKEIPQKDAKIYVYCLSGSRSSVAVAQMAQMGYTDVFDMKSGLLAWQAKKLPLEE